MAYELAVVKNHLLIAMTDGLALLDTGSPQSYGAGGSMQLGVKTHGLSPDSFGVLDLVREQVHPDIRYFLGHETLKDYRTLVDWPGGKVTFSAEPIALDGAGVLPMELVMDVPRIPIEFNGARTTAILDSGAALSYAPDEAVENLQVVRTVTDFFPGVGDFETGVRDVEVGFPHRRLCLQAGTLPQILALTLGMICSGWILGADFFRDRRVVLDYPGAQVLDADGARVMR
ncbi:MAG: hypothetical protein ACR2G6_07615 [Gemmatimonadaceae bacterium]